MNLRNGCQQYREQSIMTASQGDLVLMLYDGSLHQLRLARMALDDIPQSLADASKALIKTQDLLSELIQGLDFHYEIAGHLFRVYEYLQHELIQINIKKESARIQNIEEILSEMRSTWEKAIKITRGNNQAVGE